MTTILTNRFTVQEAAKILNIQPNTISTNLARKHANIWREALQLSDPPGTGHIVELDPIDIVVIRMLIDLAAFPNETKHRLATEIYDYWNRHPQTVLRGGFFGVEIEYGDHTLVHYTPDWEILNTIKEHNG